MLNHQIQNYNFISLLGEGGMATVYLAHDNKFDTDVAIKVLNKEFVNNENIRKRFLAEARSMFKMSHPNIIKVTDLIEDGDTVAFVMEYVEGETLKEYIERKGKLSDSEIKTIFSQMLDAVGYVHEQNLVHRDIKPSNFMLDKNGKIKLMDFGIAKTTDSNSAEYTQTGTGMQMGTPMYMSPEQIRSSKEVNHLTDIYSLGVVLWQMVVGQKPYDTRTLSNFDLQSKIVNEPLPKSNTVWDRIIEKATQKELDKRFLNCINFKDDVIGGRNFTSNKNEENTVDHTIVEQPLSKEKETYTPENNKEISIKNQKKTWIGLTIARMIITSIYFFYYVHSLTLYEFIREDLTILIPLNYLLLVFSIKILNVKVLRLLVIGELLFYPIIFILVYFVSQYGWYNIDSSIIYGIQKISIPLSGIGGLIFQILTLRKLSKI